MECMDLILKVNLKLQKCKQNLQAFHLVHGNSVERQHSKECLENALERCGSLVGLFQSILICFSGLFWAPSHLSKRSRITQKVENKTLFNVRIMLIFHKV